MENGSIRVGTYNTGDFSGDGIPAGSDAARAAFREVIEAEGIDLWALQEDVGFFNADTEELPYHAVYDSYPTYLRRGEKKYNYKAFLTALPIGEVEQIYYQGEEKFGHPWFLHTQIELNGHDVCLICLHFDWADRFTRAAQIAQVIDFANRYEYAMILGDFNPDDFIAKVKQSDNPTYEVDLDAFRRAGYNVANADRFGVFTTTAGSIRRGRKYPCDNIIVSANIKIHKVGLIFRDWMNDHAALWADVEIC